MAISFAAALDPTIIEVIVSRDPAIDRSEERYPELPPLEGEEDDGNPDLRTRFGAAYAAYLNDLDESRLVLHEGQIPTRWHLRVGGSLKDQARTRDLTYSLANKVRKQGGGKVDESSIPIFTLMLETVRGALVDVRTGEESHMKKAPGGGASDQILAVAMKLDAISELYAALQVRESGPDAALAKKN